VVLPILLALRPDRGGVLPLTREWLEQAVIGYCLVFPLLGLAFFYLAFGHYHPYLGLWAVVVWAWSTYDHGRRQLKRRC
jgi:hypothetical protein